MAACLSIINQHAPHSVAIPMHPIRASHGWLASMDMHGGLLQMKHVEAAI